MKCAEWVHARRSVGVMGGGTVSTVAVIRRCTRNATDGECCAQHAAKRRQIQDILNHRKANSMKIRVEFELAEDDEAADPGHEMGVTNDAFETLHEAVASLGGDDMNVERVE